MTILLSLLALNMSEDIKLHFHAWPVLTSFHKYTGISEVFFFIIADPGYRYRLLNIDENKLVASAQHYIPSTERMFGTQSQISKWHPNFRKTWKAGHLLSLS